MDLRARSRWQTMQRVQSVALDLFEQHGYEAVSVADIAREAEVAERTIYRHFGSKERLVTADELDDRAFAEIAQLAADHDLRTATRLAIEGLRADASVSGAQWSDGFRKLRLVYGDQALRTAFSASLSGMVVGLAVDVAHARGLPPDDLATRAAVAAVFAALECGIEGALDEATPQALVRELLVCIDALDRF